MSSPLSLDKNASGTASQLFVKIHSWERFAIVLLFGCIGLLIGLLNLTQGRTDLTLVYIAFVVFLLVLMLPFLLLQREAAWFHPLIFTVLWLGLVREVLPSLGMFIDGLQRHRALPGFLPVELNAVVVQVLVLTSLGYLCLYVGYGLFQGIRVPRVVMPEPSHLVMKVLIIAGISAGAFVLLMSEAGGIERLLLQRGLPASQRIKAHMGSHWQFLVGLLKPACLVWFALDCRAWKRPIFFFVFGLALFMGFSVSGSRSGVIVPIIKLMSIWALQHRKLPYVGFVTIGVLAIGLLGFLGEFRHQTIHADSLQEVRLDSGIVDSLKNGLATITRYSGEISGEHAIVARVPQDVDMLWGRSYLSIFTMPIPRKLWQDKPVAGGKLNSIIIYDNPNSAIPPGMIGEAFWNFHVPGVIVVMMAFGGVLCLLGKFYRVNEGTGWITVIYIICLFGMKPQSPSVYKLMQSLIPACIFIFLYCGLPKLGKKN